MGAGLAGVGEARGIDDITLLWERGREDVVGREEVVRGDWMIVSEEHWVEGTDAKVAADDGGMGGCEGGIEGV